MLRKLCTFFDDMVMSLWNCCPLNIHNNVKFTLRSSRATATKGVGKTDRTIYRSKCFYRYARLLYPRSLWWILILSLSYITYQFASLVGTYVVKCIWFVKIYVNPELIDKKLQNSTSFILFEASFSFINNFLVVNSLHKIVKITFREVKKNKKTWWWNGLL